MSDIFREIDEDLRRDRMERFFKRYGSMVLSIALVLVAATGGYVAWQAWQRSSRSEATTALAAAVSRSAQAPEEAVKALSTFAGEAPAAHATLARLDAAAGLARAGKPAEAVSVYDAVAADGAAQPLYREFATLMAVMHGLDSGDPAALIARLEPLTAESNPWRFTARELSGLLAARTGDAARAHTLFQQLAEDPQTPAGTRGRAADLAALYGSKS